ncbi:hypothetical protein LX03_03475 [Limosilactobacillus mucosae]|uniref:Uncharacterized protein n=1 Tax=Limosilactobacillus mucosae TaxID=97478 RepID=A0A099YCP9_LIMMU|nr:hypothetical protein LX03_03475 [Limosilactobacillus mucosae]
MIKETIKTVLSVNYEASQKIAWEVLKKYADYKLPISLGEIIKKIPNIHLMTYSKIAALYGCKPNEVSDITGSEDGGILWYRPSKMTASLLMMTFLAVFNGSVLQLLMNWDIFF